MPRGRRGTREPLTDETIAALRKGARDQWLPDASVPGLRLRVTKQGAKTWSVTYRSPTSRRVETAVLGRWPEVQVHEAQMAAAGLRRKIRDGGDPQSERRAARAGALTFGVLADRYVESKRTEVAQSTREMHATSKMWTEQLHATPISTLKLEHVDRALAHLADRPAARWRARVFVNQVLRWGHVQYGSPIPTLGRKLERLSERDRVLADSEIVAVLRALDSERPPIRLAVKLMLATGQRVGEVLGMDWSEITVEIEGGSFVDLAALWTIPGRRRKTKDGHAVALPSAVFGWIVSELGVDELGALQGRLPSGSVLGLSHISREQWQKRVCRNAQSFGARVFQFRDFRRTAASGMARLGTDDDIIRRILGHVAATTTAAVYQRYTRLPERREALRKWASHIDRCADTARRLDAGAEDQHVDPDLHGRAGAREGLEGRRGRRVVARSEADAHHGPHGAARSARRRAGAWPPGARRLGPQPPA
jgi:integrase